MREPQPHPTYDGAAAPDRSRPTLPRALAGFVPGLALNAMPALLVLAYLRSFTATATPDSGFNVLTLGALAFLLLDAALLLGALIALAVPTARPVATGYLGGLVVAALGLLVLAQLVG